MAAMFRCIRTLKSKILFYCFTITVIVLALVISLCLVNFNVLVKLNKIQTVNHNLCIFNEKAKKELELRMLGN